MHHVLYHKIGAEVVDIAERETTIPNVELQVLEYRRG